MPWPLSQDYNEAIQNPATSFGDPELRQCEAKGNAIGIAQGMIDRGVKARKKLPEGLLRIASPESAEEEAEPAPDAED